MASMASIPGVDVAEALPMEAARKKTKKKSKRGVYRPKIQTDVVFKRSTARAAAKTAEVTPKKKYTRKKKAGKRVEDVGDGGKDDVILCGEDSMVVGVGGAKIEGAGVFPCTEGVVFARESFVPLPEIVGVAEEKKVVKKGEEVGIGDGTPPPMPLAVEWKFPKTYVRRRRLNAKRCLDFGLGKKGTEVGFSCERLEKFEFPVGKTRGEVIVEEGGREEDAMVVGTFNHVAFTRKPRTKRARKAGPVKLISTHPCEWSSLPSKSKKNLKTVVNSGGCNGKSLRYDLLPVNVLRKQRTLRGKRRDEIKIVGEMVFAKKKKNRATCCRVSINDHLSALVPRKQRTFKSKDKATNEEPLEKTKMKMPIFEIECLDNFDFPTSSIVEQIERPLVEQIERPLVEQIERPLVVPKFLEGAIPLSGLANGLLVEQGMVVNNTRVVPKFYEGAIPLSGLIKESNGLLVEQGLAKESNGLLVEQGMVVNNTREFSFDLNFHSFGLVNQIGLPLPEHGTFIDTNEHFSSCCGSEQSNLAGLGVAKNKTECLNNLNIPSSFSAKQNENNSAKYSSHGQPLAQALLPSTSLQAQPQNANAIVPYRKKAHRNKPEILIDDVSRIMWRLTETEEISEMDAETEERCTKEHELFNGLVQKFIAIMRLVQGDKSYSKWNGSVLDSIVGAYLTQNVTDTLSSHAFMCLASRFPPQRATNGFNVRGSKENESEDMHRPEANENGSELFYDGVCSNADDSLKKKTVHGMTEKLQECSIRESESLEQKATSSSTPIVPEGQTLINLQHDKESKTDNNFQRKDEFTDTAKAKAAKGKSVYNKKNEEIDWDILRREVCCNYFSQERSVETMDSIDYEALKNATVEEVASIIKIRGMNNRIAKRIKDSLNRFVKLHGTMNMEWLRLTPEDKTKDYLLHIIGLGLKSVECIRLLCLQQHAFPVDTNVARISVRLGWVPLQPLPQNIQIHVLDQYPDVNKIQQYLWPRLRRLNPQTLYELHYQMITFGKVFCTKSRPNCKACPLKEDCRHYASLCASERLALPSPGEKQNSPQKSHSALVNIKLLGTSYVENSSRPPMHEPPKFYVTYPDEDDDELIGDPSQYVGEEENALGLQDQEVSNGPFVGDIEDFPWSLETFPQKTIADLKDINMSNALVPLSPKAASTRMPKLKQLSRLRTEHLVYELPDDHPLVAKLEPRVAHDSCPYLLNIWLPGETADSIQTSMAPCNNIRESGGLCNEVTCFECNNAREGNSQSVKGTLLIPSRTAMRGSFPLNGTYFQMNEVFADDETSRQPIEVSRNLIWNLRTTKLYCGSNVTATTRGFSLEQVCEAFRKGYFCFKGFEQSTRFPKPVSPRLNCRLNKSKSTKPRKSSENDNG